MTKIMSITDHDSAGKHETNQDNVESKSELSKKDGNLMDDTTCCSAPLRTNGHTSPIGDAS